MKAIYNKLTDETKTTLFAVLAIAIAITIFFCSLSSNQLALLLQN